MSEIIEGVRHIDKEELHELLHSPEHRSIIVVDVREPHEYIAGHIPTLPLVPMNEIAAYADQMDKEREYVFVCRSGYRSLQVSKYFQHLGFPHITNYLGGMLEWDKEIVTGPEKIIEDFSPEQLER
ncbi:rhodanese-like domain-containing protein [Paenibacillus sp. CAA11]|uniref:rhodanese-like domain-containing protein n=1 Tax=Paenibacillus sp. CAA11 TaxID=1532905 RepID=UPI000D3A916B|nr:rhodanese-like domain-containing protein [Paenibacillus sp. CAA11]AWB43654.1 rhodanese-like domain-containing protein [Paenibacillus sp. CAA11]